MGLRTLGLSVFLAVGLAASVHAQEVKFSGNTVSITFPSHGLVTLEIVGPKDFYMKGSSNGSSASIDIGSPADGLYKYQVFAASGVKISSIKQRIGDNGRSREPSTMFANVSASGSFVVEGGKIVSPAEEPKTDKDG